MLLLNIRRLEYAHKCWVRLQELSELFFFLRPVAIHRAVIAIHIVMIKPQYPLIQRDGLLRDLQPERSDGIVTLFFALLGQQSHLFLELCGEHLKVRLMTLDSRNVSTFLKGLIQPVRPWDVDTVIGVLALYLHGLRDDHVLPIIQDIVLCSVSVLSVNALKKIGVYQLPDPVFCQKYSDPDISQFSLDLLQYFVMMDVFQSPAEPGSGA